MRSVNRLPKSLRFTKSNDGVERCSVGITVRLSWHEVWDIIKRLERSGAFTGSTHKKIAQFLNDCVQIGLADCGQDGSDI